MSDKHSNGAISQRKKLRILTVGDGDLSLSLAIAKCYISSSSSSSSSSSTALANNSNNHSAFVELTASTLLDSPQTLFATYPQTAPAILKQLQQTYNVKVLFGVDACFLHERFSKSNHDDNDGDNGDEHVFDLVLFHHPHLGSSSSDNDGDNNDDDEDTELDLVQRHSSLLAHYLASAQQIAKTVHVALCSNQAVSWRLVETAHCLNLQLIREIPVQHPFHQIFSDHCTNHTTIVDNNNNGAVSYSLFPWQNDPDWKPPPPPPPAVDVDIAVAISRKQKSRHWLGRYGYQHVRTIYKGQSEAPNLAGSTHYVFQREKAEDESTLRVTTTISSIPPAPNLSSSSSSSATAETSLTASSPSSATTTTTTCPVCGITFQDQTSLEMHITAPAIPSCLIASAFEQTEMASDHRLSTTTAASSCNDTKQLELTRQQSNRIHVSTPARGQNGESSSSPSSPAGGGDALIVLTVPCDYEGKRLRWFLQHCSAAANSNNNKNHKNNNILSKLSKRQWEGLIKNGGVSVNGVVAMDSGRILCTGWTVSVHSTISSNSNSDKGEKNAATTRGVVGASLLQKPLEQNSHHLIQVVAREEHGDVAFCIVWKPVGMRTIGSFDSCTLEETFTRQQHQQQEQQLQLHANNNSNSITAKYKSLSKLDTGCSGLCVLQNVNYRNNCNKEISANTNSPLVKVTHTFTILVHGRVPDEWQTTPGGISIVLPTAGMRRWKKQKQNAPTNNNGSESSISSSSSSSSSCSREVGCPATLCYLEQATLSPMMGCRTNKNHDKNVDTTSSSLPLSGEILSTIAITTNSQSSGLAQTISYYLRKTAGHPIVGDRFAVSEYLSLPRSIRNRIKQRLCMGCTSVLVTIPGDNSSGTGQQQYTRAFECKVPEKWSAAFWREFCVLRGSTYKMNSSNNNKRCYKFQHLSFTDQ